MTNAVPRCAACDSASYEPIFGGLLRCKDCGHAFAPPEATDEDLAAIYTENYFTGEEYHNYLADKDVAQRNFRARLRVLKRFMDPARHRRLFEVGCAYGFFLEAAKDVFASVQGVDVSAAAAGYAKNNLHLDATCADFLKYDLGTREFDVACMWDTIEHLAHPDLYIAKLADHMKTGALIAITTGDFASLNARVRRTKWRLMHPPSHAHYFSIASMTTMLDRFDFDTVYARHCGYYRSLRSMAYGVFVQKHGDTRALDLMNRLGLGGFPLYLNFYDIMYVIGRKR
ncbi:class I SAM-dependent methyltransferase [Candidatus Binatus sp.]|uniref:class I SAM-dependent methyltransferase n=1 Tax=Candidatus Binatus sp. TaxID=2811406 RepID=UPI003C3BB329